MRAHLIYGNIGKSASSDYALVGPLATWQISITEADNTGLVKTGIKEAYFEFEGPFSAF